MRVMITSPPTDRLYDVGDKDQQVQARLDQRYMASAIRFARKHEGLTADNPSVGALIVRYENNQPIIVGRGVTEVGGRPHAEVVALNEAGDLAKGACAYVTLEPCAHFGKTPPCANALIAAGVTRVVVAANDPDSRVSGKGFETLHAAGIQVVTNVLVEKAEYGLAGFLKRTAEKRSFITLKLAMTADGIMGAHSGEQIKITNEISNAQVHIMRAINDAILVGSGTVINDDPSLSCRLPGLVDRSPARVILDRRLQVSAKSQLLQTADKSPTTIATSSTNTIVSPLKNLGINILDLNGMNEDQQLAHVMEKLAGQGISTLLVEGGVQVANAFLKAGLVDRLVVFQSDKKIGAIDGAVKAPITPQIIGVDFVLKNQLTFGSDIMYVYQPKNKANG